MTIGARRDWPDEPPSPAADWGWFAAWCSAGASYPVAVLGALSIGIFVLPVAIALTIVLATRRTSLVGLPGVISGVGLPLLYVAFRNRVGPGNICRTFVGRQSCTQEWSPWPWLATGLVFLVVGVAVFLVRRRAMRRPSPRQSDLL